MGTSHSSMNNLDTDAEGSANDESLQNLDDEEEELCLSSQTQLRDISPVVSDREDEQEYHGRHEDSWATHHRTRREYSSNPWSEERNEAASTNPLEGIGWQPSSEEYCLEDVTEATCSFLSSQVTGAILDEKWNFNSDEGESDSRFLQEHASDTAGSFFPWTPPNGMLEGTASLTRSRLNDKTENYIPMSDFYPPLSQGYEWMGRSIETLLLGYRSTAPVLALPQGESTGVCDEDDSSKDDTSPKQESRCSLLSCGAKFRRKSSPCNTTITENAANGGGPNVLLSLLAREGSGKPCSLQSVPPTRRLREMGGTTLLNHVDKPAAGMAAEVALLEDAIDRGDWTETQIIISRLVPRLVSDPTRARNNDIDDASLPPSASRFHAGGGRLGLERETFVLSGGVRLLVRVFGEPSFVGDEIQETNDARDLSDGTVARKLSSCWNEMFAILREMVYALPVVVENGDVLGGGDFLPFLFTVLAHKSCFDGAVALIEEILSVMANSMQQVRSSSSSEEEIGGIGNKVIPQSRIYVAPPSPFFLGNVPDVYELMSGFSCRQLAHFCRVLALLIFEPEDRNVLESPSVLKSLQLLQLRRDRAARAGRDATVDMNHSILIGDTELIGKLLKLLRVMNFGPPLTNGTPYHVMTFFPFVAGTLPMLGLDELRDFEDIDRLEALARKLLTREDGEGVCGLGGVTRMLESLSDQLRPEIFENTSQIGHIINVISAATRAGLVVGMPQRDRESNTRSPSVTVQNVTDPSILESIQSTDGSNVEAEEAHVVSVSIEGSLGEAEQVLQRANTSGPSHVRFNTPKDAANVLQFNSFILAPFQVEVLFVLCTLLGGRRQIDAQDILRRHGLIRALEGLFERLSFSRQGQEDSNVSENESEGIHGPGCECTPESALTIQFLRLVHNFCDRDCDNHSDKRLLLSASEREFIFASDGLPLPPSPDVPPGLLSKVIQAFVAESDDSPYRFWLASCVEAYLRGSTIQEQYFVAQSGLLSYLLEHVSSERIHCAGSLQTSFDLLGEVCKGNVEVLGLLMSKLDEDGFRRLMRVAASNLVDSNVFIRALILSLEKEAAAHAERCTVGKSTRFYLTHAWWDAVSDHDTELEEARHCDNSRPSDWFPPFQERPSATLFSPSSPGIHALSAAATRSPQSSFPSFESVEFTDSARTMARFLNVNRPHLVQALLQVVDLQCINHENICCLNTAIIIFIFSRRRGELCEMVDCLKGLGPLAPEDSSTLVESMQALAIDHCHHSHEGNDLASSDESRARARRFRELIWFWNEYYSHRGRDRISIEFSSHLHFYEWQKVVSILSGDNTSRSSLVSKPIRLPRSPYQCSPRLVDVMSNGARGE